MTEWISDPPCGNMCDVFQKYDPNISKCTAYIRNSNTSECQILLSETAIVMVKKRSYYILYLIYNCMINHSQKHRKKGKRINENTMMTIHLLCYTNLVFCETSSITGNL